MESETDKGQQVSKWVNRGFQGGLLGGGKESGCSDKLKLTYAKQLTSNICLNIIHCLTDSALTRVWILGIRCMKQKGEKEKLPS
jgi:hypothetical protein